MQILTKTFKVTCRFTLTFFYLYLLLICERVGIDLNAAAAAKIDANEQKYPVDKSRGSARKYTQL